MSFITPSTALSGSVLPPSQWNSQVRDNISYLYNQLQNYQTQIASYAGSVTSLSGSVSAIYPQTVGTITSNYTIGTSDINKMYKVNPSGGTITITLENENPIGSKVDFVQTGMGTVTVLFNEWVPQTGIGSRNWVSIASSSDGTSLAAVDNGGYIYTSTDSGVTWVERTSSGARNWASVASSSDGTKLVAGVYNSAYKYIYTSSDSGVTWTERTSAGSRNWRSVASSSDGTKLVAVVTSGQYIHTSSDSGVTWTERTSSGSRNWNSVASSSDGTKLAAVDYGGYTYTSTDSGVTWTGITSSGYRNWYSITSSSDGTKLAAVDYGGYIYTKNVVDIYYTPSNQMRTQYSAASIIKLNDTDWLLTGDLY